MFLRILSLACGFIILLGSLGCSSRQGDFPSADITLVVQSSPGGGSDFVSRTLAAGAEKYLGRKINVINKPGAAGAIGMGYVANAKPDGYTIGFAPTELAFLKYQGYTDISSDKFELIMQAVTVPAALSVRADSPYKTLSDFLAAAKNKPGKISVGNSGTGSIWNLGAIGLEKVAGVRFNHIPFDGAAPALVAVLGGHIDATVSGCAEAFPHVQAGKIRILGVMDKERFPFLETVPTFRDAGYDLLIAGWGGLLAPQGTPPHVVKILHDAFKKAFDETAVKEAYDRRGFGHTYARGPDFTTFIDQQSHFFEPLLAEIGGTKTP